MPGALPDLASDKDKTLVQARKTVELLKFFHEVSHPTIGVFGKIVDQAYKVLRPFLNGESRIQQYLDAIYHLIKDENPKAMI